MDTRAIDHLLTTTRAVRRRLDLERPVELEVVRECLRLALQAPTGANRQGWRWLVVRDRTRREALAELYRASAEVYLRQQGEKVADERGARMLDSALYLAEHLEEVPVHVVPCIRGRADGAANAVAAGLYGSILPAVWSFMLALRSRGLGSSWTTLHLPHEREAAELLGIPEDYMQVALVPVAYYLGEDFRPAHRRPVEDVAFLDHWDNPLAAGGA